MASPYTMVPVAGHDVRVSNPDKVFFSARGETKLDLVQYYLAVGAGALRAVHLRPTVLKRFPEGAEGKLFFQKRVPPKRPDWLQTATVAFPSGRTAEELCPTDMAHLIWAVNLGCIDFNPWAVRRWDLDHPDELRVDLDPQPGVTFDEVRQVAGCVREVLDDHGLVGYPKTSGSRGIHVNVRVDGEVGLPRGSPGRPRLSPARSSGAGPTSPRRSGGRRSVAGGCSSTTTRTPATAPSPPPTRCAPTPRRGCRARSGGTSSTTSSSVTSRSRPCRRATSRSATSRPPSTTSSYSLTSLLELAARDEAEGLGDAPWPPNFAKQAGEPPRVQPSRARQAHGTAS